MLLSIVIPVYNLEKYIGECLDSCLNQDFKDYEIICIDDGSVDKSSIILDEYQKKYPEIIKVFHKANGGVSSARNLGIEKATGEWIWFVDGDDIIVENCLTDIFKEIQEDDEYITIDLIRMSSPKLNKLNTKNINTLKIPFNKSLNVFPTHSYAGGAYSYLLRLDKIKTNNLLFDETMKYSEDVKFIFLYKLLCEKGGRLFDNIVYCYRQREDSAMHTVDFNEQNKCMKVLMHLYNDAMQTYKQLEKPILEKRTLAIQVIQSNLLYRIKDYDRAVREINELKNLGFYPYKPINNHTGKTASKKAFVLNMIKRSFHNEKIFLFMCKVLSKI